MLKKLFFLFLGVLFCTSSKGFVFVAFFFVIMRPQTIPLWIFSYLSFFFSSIFSSTSKRHFFPFFSSSPLLPESSVFPLFHILLLTECFLSIFLSHFLVLLIHLFLFICPLSIIYFSFPIFFNLS